MLKRQSLGSAFFLFVLDLDLARTKLPRMPLTKETTSWVSYRLAISTASLMAAALGTSGTYSTSYMAVRMMAAAMRGMRAKDQPTA